jgi:hypothetical protein
MKRIGITAMIVGCIFAFSAIVAGSAAASSFSLCLRVDVKATGTYQDAKCESEKAKGEYILVTPVKKLSAGVWCAKLDNGSTKGNYETSACTTEVAEKGAYTAVKVTREEEGVPPAEFIPADGQVVIGEGGVSELDAWYDVTCEKSTLGGSITSRRNVGGIVIKFTGCVARGEGVCTAKSLGASKEGEIVTNTLKGLPGTVKESESTSPSGLLLLPETTGQFFRLANSSCVEEAAGGFNGSVAGELLPTGSNQLTAKLDIANSRIKKIGLLGGFLEPKITGYAGIGGSASTLDALTFSEATEVT